MSQFEDREKSFEEKYAHDQELDFRIAARRNKLAGLWAAGLMGLRGPAADAYAHEVVESDFKAKGDDDVLAKIWGDLKANAAKATEADVRKKLVELLPEAKRQVMNS